MARHHVTFAESLGTHITPGSNAECGSPVLRPSVLHLADAVNGNVLKGNDRYERGEYIAGISQEKPQSKIATQEARVVKTEPRTLTKIR
jgi:hypothetical protein